LKGSAIVAASDVRSEKLLLGRKATARSEETPTKDHRELFGSDARESTEGMHAGTVLYIASLLRAGAEPGLLGFAGRRGTNAAGRWLRQRYRDLRTRRDVSRDTPRRDRAPTIGDSTGRSAVVG